MYVSIHQMQQLGAFRLKTAFKSTDFLKNDFLVGCICN